MRLNPENPVIVASEFLLLFCLSECLPVSEFDDVVGICLSVLPMMKLTSEAWCLNILDVGFTKMVRLEFGYDRMLVW